MNAMTKFNCIDEKKNRLETKHLFHTVHISFIVRCFEKKTADNAEKRPKTSENSGKILQKIIYESIRENLCRQFAINNEQQRLKVSGFK